MFVEKNSKFLNFRYPLIFLIAFLAGTSDCCFNGVRSVICALVMPSRRAQSFSVSRMYQAAACVIIFFFSPTIPLYIYTFGLPILAVCSTIVFFKVSKVFSQKNLTSHQNIYTKHLNFPTKFEFPTKIHLLKIYCPSKIFFSGNVNSLPKVFTENLLSFQLAYQNYQNFANRYSNFN
nr:hypothetical protein B0554.7 - Caenorhabditis elegans [Caenorhabditis elegans]